MPFRMHQQPIWQKILEKENKRIPVITTLHGTDITLVGRDKTYAPVVTFSINESDAITAVSENLREETFKSFKIEKEIEVIYNFVDVNRFSRKPIEVFKNQLLLTEKESYCIFLISED